MPPYVAFYLGLHRLPKYLYEKGFKKMKLNFALIRNAKMIELSCFCFIFSLVRFNKRVVVSEVFDIIQTGTFAKFFYILMEL